MRQVDRIPTHRGNAFAGTELSRRGLPTRDGFSLAYVRCGDVDVTQRSIEIVIGRLLTDEDFRETFLSNPHAALGELLDRGTQLSLAEIAALVGIDSALWVSVAEQIDPRLQKASLKAPSRASADATPDGDNVV
jgi:hypothetical protein